MTERQLIVIHVGPVQDFIATARRSRDLWFGSWLLSELSKTCALEIVRQNESDVECLIFPAPNDLADLESEDFNVANKVVALVKQSPVELGPAIQEAILKRLCEVRDEAYTKVGGTFYPDRSTAERQVDDLLEFFWAAHPVNGNYSEAREMAESLLAARKVTRNFLPVTWGSSVPKSSLDGQRESVIPETAYPAHNAPKEYRTDAIRKLRVDFGVRGEGERLCGVGLLKRHGKRGSGSDRFFSTSHVAALPLLEQLTNQSATNEYINRLKGLGILSEELGNTPTPHAVFGRYDGHLLFEERLSEFFEDTDKLDEAKDALRNFRRAAFSHLPEDHQRPIPYYALLAADGDRMGRAINEQKTVEEHRTLSQKLTRFAGTVAEIIKRHKGSLVYSGGDDVLAFVPLHTVLACARSLAETFRLELAPFTVLEDGKEMSPTLSVGIAVAHHLEPLSDALTLVRSAEKAAKSVDGKNSLAVTVSKRSGVDRTVTGTWGTIDQRLNWFIALHRADAIPDGAAFDLLELAHRLRVPQLRECVSKEAIRILRRKESQHGRQSVAKDVLDQLEHWINTNEMDIEQLALELIIAREFAATQDLAMTPPQAEKIA